MNIDRTVLCVILFLFISTASLAEGTDPNYPPSAAEAASYEELSRSSPTDHEVDRLNRIMEEGGETISSYCCKIFSKGKACGDSRISCS